MEQTTKKEMGEKGEQMTTKDWKLENKIEGHDERYGDLTRDRDFIWIEHIKEFLRRVLERGFGHNRNIPHGVVAIDDIIELAGKSLVEKESGK